MTAEDLKIHESMFEDFAIKIANDLLARGIINYADDSIGNVIDSIIETMKRQKKTNETFVKEDESCWYFNTETPLLLGSNPCNPTPPVVE